MGNYGIQVSNNPTPFPTGTPIVYTVVQDHALASGQGSQTKNWTYYIKNGWKWWRAFAIPDQTNGGTLGIQVRQFGPDSSHSYQEGVPWQSNDTLQASTANVASTIYYDYKLPMSAHGFNIYDNVSAVSGACTLTQTVFVKDPYSGALQSVVGQSALTHSTGLNTLVCAPGIALPTQPQRLPLELSIFQFLLGRIL